MITPSSFLGTLSVLLIVFLFAVFVVVVVVVAPAFVFDLPSGF